MLRKLGKPLELDLKSKRKKQGNTPTKVQWAYNLGATFDYQQKWIADDSRYKMCVKARQIGMTTAIAIDALVNALLEDEYVHIIVSPSQRQSDRLIWYINKAFSRLQKKLGEKIPLLTHKRDSLVFKHGSEIHSMPNNPATVMGFDADEITIDEAGIFPTGEGEKIYEATMGSLAAKGGRMSLSGMPYGRGKFFFEQYEGCCQKKNGFSLHLLDWTHRAKQDPLYAKSVEEHRKYLSPLQFSQTYECNFVDENIVMFPYDILHACVDEDIRLLSGNVPYSADGSIFLGIDFAKKIDKTSVVGVKKTEKGYKVFLIKSTREPYDKQLEIIKTLNKNLEPQKIFIDESGPGVPMLDFLQKEVGSKVIPIPFSAQNKERLMIDLRNMMVDGRLRIPDHRDLIDELHSIEKSVTDLGNVRYLAPRDEGGHADMAFALSLAVNQLDNTDFRFQII